MDYENVIIFIGLAWLISMITVFFMLRKIRQMAREIRELKNKIPAKAQF